MGTRANQCTASGPETDGVELDDAVNKPVDIKEKTAEDMINEQLDHMNEVIEDMSRLELKNLSTSSRIKLAKLKTN